MKVAQKYFEPILGISSANYDMRFWNKAIDAYQSKKYKDSLLNLLNYLDPYILKKNKDLEAIMVAHGSIVLQIKIQDDKLTLIAPFVKMGQDNPTPLLRQITEINFSVLVLSQIQLREDELYFYFESPINVCEPYKIYDALYEICIQADYFDDIFVDELGAKRIREPEVKPFSGRQKKNLWNRYQELLKECDEYLHYFKTERSYAVGIDAALTTMLKLDYALMPQGKLRSDIEKLIGDGLKQSDSPYAERLDQIIAMIDKLKKYDETKFFDSMYIPHFFISIKSPIPLERVKQSLQNDFANAQKEMAHSHIISANYFLSFAIYNLLYRYSPPRKIEELLNSALKKSSGKDWGTASQILFNTVQKIMGMK